MDDNSTKSSPTNMVPYTIGLCLLAFVLVLVIILALIAIYLFLKKLKQHEVDILKLQLELEKGTADVQPSNNGNEVEMTDVNVNLRNNSRVLSYVSDVSHKSTVRPRMTIKIRKETANVYGHTKPCVGQTMMLAQDFYKKQTNSTTDVPAESVEVVNKVSNTRSVQSRIFSEDWREGIPTSLLFEGSTSSFDNVVTHNKGIFVHKTIGPLGGRLDISGVSLVIPPNALQEKTLITLGVLWDEKFHPTLTKKQSLLSPLVLCQPSSTKFKVPVVLTFPHAAHKITRDWVPKIFKRAGALTDDSSWTTVTLADYSERVVSDYTVTLHLNHFTLYTLTGESKPGKVAVKKVNLVAFAGKLARGAFFKPRIYCLNSYNELEDVEAEDRCIDPNSKMAETTSLMLHDNEQDIMVELAKLSDDWKVAGDNTESLPFELAWHACHPHCTFILKSKSTSQPEIICEFHAYQNGNENQFVKLKIAESVSALIPLGSSKNNPKDELMNELIILLDADNAVASDWKTLAEKMGCGLARIRWLAGNKSPTQVLIEQWLADNHTYKQLEELMVEIERPDAAEEIRNRLPNIEPFTDS